MLHFKNNNTVWSSLGQFVKRSVWMNKEWKMTISTVKKLRVNSFLCRVE